jgi:hypothetical protein
MRPYLITAKLMRPSNMKRFPTPGIEILELWGIPPPVGGGRIWCSLVGPRFVSMRDVFILNEIWAQHKVYIF